MNTTLYLTADEKSVFEKLPEELKEGWTVEDETQDSYESDEDLAMRAHMANFEDSPNLKSAIENVQKTGEPGDISLDDVPEKFYESFFFTIGAVGMTVFLRAALLNAESEEDMGRVCLLGIMRNEMLKANSTINYTS